MLRTQDRIAPSYRIETIAATLPHLPGLPRPDGLLAPLAASATRMAAPRDTELVAQDTPARFCFEVTAGCLRTVRLLSDGRRQIGEFLFPGDVHGCEVEGLHAFALETVADSVLRRHARTAVEALADRDPLFARRMRHHAASQVRAARDHAVLLGRKTAAERIASFLLEMRTRLAADRVVVLPMGRADIADYLGLTVETVCRGLSDLRRQGAIAVQRGAIQVLNHDALATAGSEWVH